MAPRTTTAREWTAEAQSMIERLRRYQEVLTLLAAMSPYAGRRCQFCAADGDARHDDDCIWENACEYGHVPGEAADLLETVLRDWPEGR